MFDAQMFVWWGEGGGGASSFPAPHHSSVCKIARNCRVISIFAQVGRKIFKLGKLPYFKALFPAVTIDIRLHALYQKLKKKTVEASNALVQSPGQNQ